MENDPRIEEAFLASALPEEAGGELKLRLGEIYERERALYGLLKRELSAGQYALVLELMEEIAAERELTERHFFEQGWLMRGKN